MKRYIGRRNGTAADVTVDGVPLNPRRDLWNHSPSGFEWGYAGSGPAQLALGVARADCLGDEEEAGCSGIRTSSHPCVAGLAVCRLDAFGGGNSRDTICGV